jgi:hypothetical protein
MHRIIDVSNQMSTSLPVFVGICSEGSAGGHQAAFRAAAI